MQANFSQAFDPRQVELLDDDETYFNTSNISKVVSLRTPDFLTEFQQRTGTADSAPEFTQWKPHVLPRIKHATSTSQRRQKFRRRRRERADESLSSPERANIPEVSEARLNTKVQDKTKTRKKKKKTKRSKVLPGVKQENTIPAKEKDIEDEIVPKELTYEKDIPCFVTDLVVKSGNSADDKDVLRNDDILIENQASDTASLRNQQDVNTSTESIIEKPAKYIPKTALFQDGLRRIDYVLAYQDSDEVKDEELNIETNADIRQSFHHNLITAGVQIEFAPKEESQDSNTTFVKIHVPWKLVLKYAEKMKVRLPLRQEKAQFAEEEHATTQTTPHGGSHCCSCSSDSCSVQSTLLCGARCFRKNEEKKSVIDNHCNSDCFTAEFRRRLSGSFDIKSQAEFINDALRSRIAYRIMNDTKYGVDSKHLGVEYLLSKGIYTAAYPLHDGDCKIGEGEELSEMNIRKLLSVEWASWRKWYKVQPLNLIRRYLGDRYALYFAWLGFYTKMLFYAAFMGAIVLIYSGLSMNSRTAVKEACDSSFPSYVGDEIMCPLCNFECPFWNLNKTCKDVKITSFFDNEATLAYSIAMALWATLFLEFWKRRQFQLHYEWDLVEYDEDDNMIRPEYEKAADRRKINKYTQEEEPHISKKKRYRKALISYSALLFWVLVVIAAVVAIIVCKIVIGHIKYAATDFFTVSEDQFFPPGLFTTLMGTLIAFFIVQILNLFYGKVAVWLTELDLPKTEAEFDQILIYKIFTFEFANYFSYMFYIAFFKDWLGGTPGRYTYMLEMTRFEQCSSSGCMYELGLQLAATLFGKILWYDCKEVVGPWVSNSFRRWKSEKAAREQNNSYTRWEQDYDLQPVGRRALVSEYMELMIHFGFVSLFACAFPIAPFFALANNIIEIRLDAKKFIVDSRRPLARTSTGLGIWYNLLEFLGSLSVVTNAFAIAFTSETIPKLVYFYKNLTYEGFTDYSLSTYKVSDFPDGTVPNSTFTECRYRGYYSGPSDTVKYVHSADYWHILVAKLGVVIILEQGIFMLKKFVDILIPDRSRKLQEKIKREHFLVKKMMLDAESKANLAEETMSLYLEHGAWHVMSEKDTAIKSRNV